MSGVICPSYQAGFASPQRGRMKYPELWVGCTDALPISLGPTGSVLYDQSGYRQGKGTLIGGPTWPVLKGIRCLSFTGTTRWVEMPSRTFEAGDFTLSFWLHPTNASVARCIFSSSGAVDEMSISITIGSAVSIVTYSGATGGSDTTLKVTSLKWSHVAILYDSAAGVMNTYINGVLDAANTWEGTLTHTANAWYFNADRVQQDYVPFVGSQGDFHRWNRRLTPPEILLLASKYGITYEMVPPRVLKAAAAAGNRRRRVLIGGSH